MPVSGDADLLVDTSVAVALALADHAHHEATIDALEHERLGLAGHAAFETFSVLTRLPPPARRTPAAVTRLLERNFPAGRFLSPAASAALLVQLPARGIAGGSVCDALVGAVAVEHGCTLVTRDTRALETYRAVGVSLRVLT